MEHTKELIKSYINYAKDNNENYVVVVVGNVKEITKNFNDYINGTSVINDYYSLEQFNLITDCLLRNNIETLNYFDEMDFIFDFLDGRIRDNYPKKMIVLNFAQKGIVQGRKSLIPVFCEMNNIIHTNSNGFVSSFAREKFFWNLTLKPFFHVPQCWIYGKNGWLIGKPPKGQKVIVKLTNQSSSIGLDPQSAFVYGEDKDTYIENMANVYGENVLVQEFIKGREVEVPVFNDGKNCFTLPPAGIKINGNDLLGDEFLDYDRRGKILYSRFNFSKKYPTLSKAITENTIKISKFMDLQGVCRIDYRIDEDDKFYVTDINCSPHLTATSCIAKSMGYLGFESYEETILALLGLTLSRQTN